jgi:L-threonylcarbamoyladenylate synthase
VSTDHSHRDDDGVARAVDALRAGELVAFPTETVYGLGADAASSAAVAHLYAVKGRPRDHPVIVHVHALDALDRVATDVPGWARALAAECWPGPLTLVVPRRAGAVCDEVTGGRPTVGVRVPAHVLALELLEAFAGGVAAPSANRFGRVSPTTAQHVRTDLGDDVAVVLDGGACAVGVESTIVDATNMSGPRILRHGAIDATTIERVTGVASATVTDGTVAAPGTLASHYAPRARIELAADVDAAYARAAQLADAGRATGMLLMRERGADHREPPVGVVVLDAPHDADDYARVLYARMRDADSCGLDVLVAVPPPQHGIGMAVADRLRRAATVDPDGEGWEPAHFGS